MLILIEKICTFKQLSISLSTLGRVQTPSKARPGGCMGFDLSEWNLV
jgi:hypothetical protein